MSFSSSSYEITAERIRRLSSKNKRKEMCADNTVVSRAEFDAVVDKCDDATRKCEEAMKKCEEAMKKCEDALQKCDELEQFKSCSIALMSDMKKMISKLTKKKECLNNETPPAPDIDPEAFKAMKLHMDDYINNLRKGTEKYWNPQERFHHEDNQKIMEEIISAIRPALHFEDLDSLQQNLRLKKLRRMIYKKYCRYKDYVTIPHEFKEKMNYKKKINSRKAVKFNSRTKIFSSANEKEFAFSQFGTKEECESVIVKNMMSDDEDAETVINGRGGLVAVSYTRIVPSWRSEKLNAFYKELDRLYIKSIGFRGTQIRFDEVHKEVEFSKVKMAEWNVPRWALSSYVRNTPENKEKYGIHGLLDDSQAYLYIGKEPEEEFGLYIDPFDV